VKKLSKSLGPPFPVKNGEILVPNNPTSSKCVFYSIPVNIDAGRASR